MKNQAQSIPARRWIMHVDMDAFFASVEQRDHPEWQKKPVIVGGSSPRGVVATASYEARRFGVHSAMPVSRARMLCPEGIFAAPRFDVYKEVSRQIRHIMERYAEDIEPLSLDEAFMDVTGMGYRFATLGDMARAVKADILKETNLVASAGIAPNKFLAKLASDLRKPDGICIIPYGKEAVLIAPLPVRRLWGVGGVTEKKLISAGYRTIGDIQKSSERDLEKAVGSQAAVLHELAWGIDRRPVQPDRRIQSIGDETTYDHDLSDPGDIDRAVAIHCDVVARRLRKNHLAAQTVSVKVRFSSFRTVTRAVTREDPVDLQEEIYEMARRLMNRISFHEGVRLLGITASKLTEPMIGEPLFPDRRSVLARAAKAVDAIQDKYGDTSIRRGFWLEDQKRSDSDGQ